MLSKWELSICSESAAVAKKRAPRGPFFCTGRALRLPEAAQTAVSYCAGRVLVSTRTNGPVSMLTGSGRSRGTWMGLASAAMAACTAAIFAASELTHCKPELCATSTRLSVGKVVGRDLWHAIRGPRLLLWPQQRRGAAATGVAGRAGCTAGASGAALATGAATATSWARSGWCFTGLGRLGSSLDRMRRSGALFAFTAVATRRAFAAVAVT